MTTNGGPPHDSRCLAGHAVEAHCSCARRDWLQESVPRYQARGELLNQLAGWAFEQRVFAAAEIERDPAKRPAGAPGWVSAAVRAAALMAEEVYIGVRRTALALRAECDAVAKAKPAEQPVVTAQVQETLL